MEQSEGFFKVLIFPWLAHGHISPYLELSKKLSKRNFQVYFCSTPINLIYVKNILKENSSDFSIELVELHLDSSPPELPPEYHTTKGLPPNLLPTLFYSFTMAKPNFSEILNTLNPDLVIYDCFQSWAARIASSRGIPSVYFSTSGAATMAFFHHHLVTHGFEVKFPFPEIYPNESSIKKLHDVADSNFGNEEDSPFKCFELSSDIVLMKTSKSIEEKYLNYLRIMTGKRMVPLGPLIIVHENGHTDNINWLNNKDAGSVLFVSFGSEYFLSKQEREEIAFGLELSNVEFIWVLRFPVTGEKMSIEEALPEGFLERVKNRGIVVDGWIPQAKILQHASIGGFLSHCGWNSIMESLCYGKPLIAMPIKDDQPTNARLVVEIGASREVMRDENGDLKREEIAKVVKEVVLGKDSEGLRLKTVEWSDKLRLNGEEEIEEAIRELRQVCIENIQKH